MRRVGRGGEGEEREVKRGDRRRKIIKSCCWGGAESGEERKEKKVWKDRRGYGKRKRCGDDKGGEKAESKEAEW